MDKMNKIPEAIVFFQLLKKGFFIAFLVNSDICIGPKPCSPDVAFGLLSILRDEMNKKNKNQGSNRQNCIGQQRQLQHS